MRAKKLVVADSFFELDRLKAQYEAGAKSLIDAKLRCAIGIADLKRLEKMLVSADGEERSSLFHRISQHSSEVETAKTELAASAKALDAIQRQLLAMSSRQGIADARSTVSELVADIAEATSLMNDVGAALEAKIAGAKAVTAPLTETERRDKLLALRGSLSIDKRRLEKLRDAERATADNNRRDAAQAIEKGRAPLADECRSQAERPDLAAIEIERELEELRITIDAIERELG